MDRMTEQTYGAARRDRNEDGSFDVDVEYDGDTCQNCGVTAHLSLVPEFNYMGCDDCMEEALAVIAHDHRQAGVDALRKQVAACSRANPTTRAIALAAIRRQAAAIRPMRRR